MDATLVYPVYDKNNDLIAVFTTSEDAFAYCEGVNKLVGKAFDYYSSVKFDLDSLACNSKLEDMLGGFDLFEEYWIGESIPLMRYT